MATEVIQCLNSYVCAAAQKSALNVPFSFTRRFVVSSTRIAFLMARVRCQFPLNVPIVFGI